MINLIIHFFTLPPSKRIRILFYFLQALFSIICAAQLYEHFTGGDAFDGLTDYNRLMRYITSGKIMLIVFFFALTWFAFYDLGYAIVKYLNRSLVNYIMRWIWSLLRRQAEKDGQDFDNSASQLGVRLLFKLGAIERNLENPTLFVRGKSYESVEKAINQMKKMSSKKRYFMSYLILALVTQFAIIYFNEISGTLIHSSFIDAIIIILFLFYLLSFFLAVFIIESFVRAATFFEEHLKIALSNSKTPIEIP